MKGTPGTYRSCGHTLRFSLFWHHTFHSGRVLIFALPMLLSHHRPLVSFSCLVDCSDRVVPNGRGRYRSQRRFAAGSFDK